MRVQVGRSSDIENPLLSAVSDVTIWSQMEDIGPSYFFFCLIFLPHSVTLSLFFLDMLFFVLLLRYWSFVTVTATDVRSPSDRIHMFFPQTKDLHPYNMYRLSKTICFLCFLIHVPQGPAESWALIDTLIDKVYRRIRWQAISLDQRISSFSTPPNDL